MEEDNIIKSSLKPTLQEVITPKPTFVVASESQSIEKKKKKKPFSSSFGTTSQPKTRDKGVAHTRGGSIDI